MYLPYEYTMYRRSGCGFGSVEVFVIQFLKTATTSSMHSVTPTWHANPTTVGLSNLKITVICFKDVPGSCRKVYAYVYIVHIAKTQTRECTVIEKLKINDSQNMTMDEILEQDPQRRRFKMLHTVAAHETCFLI